MVNEHGALADNILHFGRLLRAAGLPVGAAQIIDATNAVRVVGIEDLSRLYWAMHTAFVKRRSERELFNQAFVIFWRDPGFLKRMMSLMATRPGQLPSHWLQESRQKSLSTSSRYRSSRARSSRPRCLPEAPRYSSTWEKVGMAITQLSILDEPRTHLMAARS